MNSSLLCIIIILVIICIILIIKLVVTKYAIKKIEQSFAYILETDTNNIIATSSSDKDIKNLVINLNNNLIKLRKQKLQYQTGNQELKKVITNISHDLRTPLTVIEGYVDLVRKEELSFNQNKYLRIIQKKTNELTELTNVLFEFSKIMDMDINLKKEAYCINEILEEILADHYNSFKKNKIVPKVVITNKKIYRSINKNSIIRVFENILSNIFKYSEGDFNVELNDKGTIIFSNRATELDVTTVQKIFDRYFTVENAKKSTGLGLSISKQLIELNGGHITAQYVDQNLVIQIDFH